MRRKYLAPKEEGNGYCHVLRHSKTDHAFQAWKIYPQKKHDGKCIRLKRTEWWNKQLVCATILFCLIIKCCSSINFYPFLLEATFSTAVSRYESEERSFKESHQRDTI